MKDKNIDRKKCCKEVWVNVGFGRFRQCSRTGTIERDGKLYCKVHDPVEVKRKNDAAEAAYKAKQMANHERWDDLKVGAWIRKNQPSVYKTILGEQS